MQTRLRIKCPVVIVSMHLAYRRPRPNCCNRARPASRTGRKPMSSPRAVRGEIGLDRARQTAGELLLIGPLP